MAKNRYRSEGRKLHLRVADCNGSGTDNLCLSGDPVVIEDLPGVCLMDEDANGETTVDTSGVWLLDVANASGAPAKPGRKVYWDDTAGTLGFDNTDKFFGHLVGKTTIPDAQTVEVEVRVGRGA